MPRNTVQQRLRMRGKDQVTFSPLKAQPFFCPARSRSTTFKIDPSPLTTPLAEFSLWAQAQLQADLQRHRSTARLQKRRRRCETSKIRVTRKPQARASRPKRPNTYLFRAPSPLRSSIFVHRRNMRSQFRAVEGCPQSTISAGAQQWRMRERFALRKLASHLHLPSRLRVQSPGQRHGRRTDLLNSLGVQC